MVWKVWFCLTHPPDLPAMYMDITFARSMLCHLLSASCIAADEFMLELAESLVHSKGAFGVNIARQGTWQSDGIWCPGNENGLRNYTYISNEECLSLLACSVKICWPRWQAKKNVGAICKTLILLSKVYIILDDTHYQYNDPVFFTKSLKVLVVEAWKFNMICTGANTQ